MLSDTYVPPDPSQIELNETALDFWFRTLGIAPHKIRAAVERVGPDLEAVKIDLGIAGV